MPTHIQLINQNCQINNLRRFQPSFMRIWLGVQLEGGVQWWKMQAR